MSNKETNQEPGQYIPTVVTPTPGRVVWFYPFRDDEIPDYMGTPLAAIVAYMWNDRLVNLMVIDLDGMPVSRRKILFLQEGDAVPGNSHACWMPYQIKQARKARNETVEVVAEDFLDPAAQATYVAADRWTEKEIAAARAANDHPILINRIESLEQIANQKKAAEVLVLFHEIRIARELVEKAKDAKCTCPSFVLQYEGSCQCEQDRLISTYENALKQLIDKL